MARPEWMLDHQNMNKIINEVLVKNPQAPNLVYLVYEALCLAQARKLMAYVEAKFAKECYWTLNDMMFWEQLKPEIEDAG